MPDDSVPYEQWSLGMADAVMDVLGVRDVRDVQAEALEQAAEFLSELPADEDADVIMWTAERMAERAQAIREARSER